MVIITRAEGKAAFDHILDNVLGRDDNSNLKKALLAEGVENVFDLLTVNDQFIDELCYQKVDSDVQFTPCTVGDKLLLKCFLSYEAHLRNEGFDGPCTAITQTEFDQFRISSFYKTAHLTPFPVTMPSQSPSSSSSFDKSPALIRKLHVMEPQPNIGCSPLHSVQISIHNQQDAMLSGMKNDSVFVKSCESGSIKKIIDQPAKEPESEMTSMALANTEDVTDGPKLLDKTPDSQPLQVCMKNPVEDYYLELNDDKKELINLPVVKKDEAVRIHGHIQLFNCPANENSSINVLNCQQVTPHQGSPSYHKSFDLKIGESTSDPFQGVANRNLVDYTTRKKLWNSHGRKSIKFFDKWKMKCIGTFNQAKLRLLTMTPKYKAGVGDPRISLHTLKLDKDNGNKKWHNDTDLKLTQLNGYKSGTDNCHHTKSQPPDSLKKYVDNFISGKNQPGNHKAQLVANDHCTNVPTIPVYSCMTGKDVCIIFKKFGIDDVNDVDKDHLIDIGVGTDKTIPSIFPAKHGTGVLNLLKQRILPKRSIINLPCDIGWYRDDSIDKSKLVLSGT
jgi:hypothetical protein